MRQTDTKDRQGRNRRWLTAAVLLVCIAANGQTYQELFAFTAIGTNGNSPRGALVEGTAGAFCGTTTYGGQPTTNCPVCGYGTVFRITPDGALTTLAWFGYTNGAYPFGAMIQATDGNFYGTAGWLFRLTPSGSLTGAAGGDLAGDPIQGTNDYIYSADARYGTVLWTSPDESASGYVYAPGQPSGGLIQASDGNFYGLTYNGGIYGFGAAYKLTPDGVLTTLASFGANPIGSNPAWPYGKMLQASDGNLYGVADNGNGIVFRLTLAGALTNLAWFGVGEAYGQSPNGGLIEAKDGNFYGTTAYGGGPPYYFSMGTVFKITPQGRITTILSFTGSGGPYPGRTPLAGLVQGSDGNLYGTCAYGGTYGGGNIFRIIMPGPELSITRLAGQVLLSWRTNYTGFTLQSSPDLSAATWTDVTNPPVTANGKFWITNTLSPAPQFFRLKK